ncbi:hypothetical protein ACFVVU_03095 [Kitasatospora sp. NPDC057965]|uniref:hypothetical protein n=1 Tax=Kitasatospora sp. NPDC057965 TaxID=3346291 RepID=UPI0036DDA99F
MRKDRKLCGNRVSHACRLHVQGSDSDGTPVQIYWWNGTGARDGTTAEWTPPEVGCRLTPR